MIVERAKLAGAAGLSRERVACIVEQALDPDQRRRGVKKAIVALGTPVGCDHALREQIVILHRRLLAVVRDDEVCRRLMTTPGVGPVVALTYRATVDVPARFRKSKSVGAVFGLTWKGLGADSEEKHEPVSDIDTAVVV